MEAPQTQNQGPMGMPPGNLPNATLILVLGILSIVLGCCFSIVGIVLGIIALVMSGKDARLYQANPGLYSEASHKNVNIGKICAIIGIILGSLNLIIGLIFFGSIMSLQQLQHMRDWKDHDSDGVMLMMNYLKKLA